MFCLRSGNNEITIQDNTSRQVENFMVKDKTIKGKKEHQISAILPTDEQLTSRAGLSVFASYPRTIAIFPIIDRKHSNLRQIVLGLDTTALLNDDTEKRHGVHPTDKKVKGFQPLRHGWTY